MRIPENIVILASIMSNITEFLQDADMVILFGGGRRRKDRDMLTSLCEANLGRDAAQLTDDRQYLGELTRSCEAKANEWEQRQGLHER